jgi:WD repeat-containing protein 19
LLLFGDRPKRPYCAARCENAQVGDASMVLSLEPLAGIEDRALLAGHALVLLERDHDAAQESFLRSRRPLAALEMRRDLKHWPQALALARRLDPGAVAGVSRQHAAALEMVGDHAAARQHYQEVGSK